MDLLNRKHLALLGGMAVLAGLYLASLYNYLFFHYVAELFSIVVAAGIFIVTWNARRYLDNHYFLFIGIAYLFVGAMDVVHTLSYKGMLIFPGYGTDLPTQLWIAARYMQSISLLAAPVFIGRRLNTNYAFAAYASTLGLLLAAIFYWKVFPVCFLEGVGLTPFKKVSEYIISLVLAGSIFALYTKREAFDARVLRLLVASVAVTIASELAFTFYVSAYGISNLIGHYFKIIAFFLMYRAVVETGLREPYNLLFRDLKQSEAKYHSLFTEMLNGCAYCKIVTDKGGRPINYVFLEINEAFEDITGFKRKDVIGRSVTEVIPGIEKDPADWIGVFGRVALTGEGARFEQYAVPLGRWYSVSAYSPRSGYFSVVFEDITERKHAEEERARLASFPELNPNPVLEVDDAGNVHYLNPAAKDLLGLDESGQHPFLADLKPVIDALKRKEKTYVVREVQVSGSWYEQAFHRVPESNRMRIYAQDITERKQAEEVIRLNEARFEALYELSFMPTATLTELSAFVLEKAVGLTKSNIGFVGFLNENEDMLTVRAWSTHAMEKCAVTDKPIHFPIAKAGLWADAVRHRSPLIINDYLEPDLNKKGLPEGHVELTRFLSVPVFDGDAIAAVVAVGNKESDYDVSDINQLTLLMNGLLHFHQRKQAEEELRKHREHLEDMVKERTAELIEANRELEREMAERKKAEAQLLQSQKMEAVGQLAGGIAHDFNNRLFAIRNYAHILKSTVDDRAAVETAEKMLASCDKAAMLVDDLLKFSRKKEINPRPADLNHILEEAENLLRVAAGKSIEFEMELSDKPLAVMADATQMEHVLINLVTNARDAMSDAGKLSVRTARAEAETVSGDIHSGGHRGPFGEIYVSDTGPGMDEKTKEKIFEPFFTTKEIGKGTGLGLSIVYGIVKQHGGHIDVRSEPGEGTTFRILLPLI